MNVISVAADQLHTFVAEVFQACGVAPEASALAADVLCYADLHGFDTHGVCNLERIYVARLLDGRINPAAVPEVIADTGATALVDGHNGLGLIVAAQAIDLAITKARAFGVGAVAVRRSSHFGSAGYYTARALAHNMIGIAMTNLGAQAIARPPGGTIAMLGTNPISVAAPSATVPPFLLDMSTTVVATGKIRAAHRKGQPIPTGWLIDDQGNPVTDPAAFDRGTGHLQFLGGNPETGGYKGYGLAMLVDILCGTLSGAKVGPDPAVLNRAATDANDDQNIGHFFLALDVSAFRPLAAFQQDMDAMLRTLLQCPPTNPEGRVLYPGYLEAMAQHEDAVSLEESVFKSLGVLAERLGISLPSVQDTTVST